MGVPNSEIQVECRAVKVVGGDCVVVFLVVVVTVGDIHLRAFESLVEKAELHADAQRAFEKFHLAACLRAGVQVAE